MSLTLPFLTCEKAFHSSKRIVFPSQLHFANYGITFGGNDFPWGEHIYLYNKRISGSDIFSLSNAAAECLLTCLPVRKTAALLLKW